MTRLPSTLFASFLLCACSSSPAPGGPDSGADAKASLLGFTPSNVDVSQLDFSGVGDVVVSSDRGWQTDLGGLLGSDNSGAYHYEEITQPNGPKLGVFTVKSLTIQAGATVEVTGADALVVVALDTIDIEGKLFGNSSFDQARVGPAASWLHSGVNTAGQGAGGGGAGSGETSGGGGGFCGTGGAGAALTGTAAQGGAPYGMPTLVPLVGGSQGGSGMAEGGAGGGAIQLVAATSITVGGVIHVGGEGGWNGGVYNPPTSEEAAGGGSGGAILIESTSVTIAGTLAANGGGGGQGDGSNGADATPDATSAPGGNDGKSGSLGGDGSAGSAVDGKAGSVDAASTAGAGGGGAGRIRINTRSGAASITGAVSPAASTPCTTQGTLG